jgi:hypothetical protein
MSKRIPLTQGKNAIVDDKDYDRLSQFKWHAVVDGDRVYAGRNVLVGDEYRVIKMHRDIMGDPEEVIVDHVDLNGLNNRRKNLRKCTIAQNTAHTRGHKKKGRTSKYKGVYRRSCGWGAQISINGRTNNLGTYRYERDAAKAYNEAARKRFGKFAVLNNVQ